MRLVLGTLLMASLAWGTQIPPCPTTSTINISKGQYAARPGVEFAIENYSAHMVPRGKQSPLCFIKVNEVEHGHVVVSDVSLSNLFEQKIAKSHQISDLKVHLKNGHVAISGKMHKGLPVPFTVEGPVDTDGRQIQLHAEKVKAGGLPIKGLLAALGMELDSLLHPGANKGVTVKGNAIFFDPLVVGNISGHIEHVQIVGQNLVVDFGSHRATLAQAAEPKKVK